MLKESTRGLEVSTHVDNEQSRIEVSTHEYSIQQSEIKVSTHRFEESTHEDNSKSGIEVSAYDTKVLAHVNKGSSLERLMIKSRHIILKWRHMETVLTTEI